MIPASREPIDSSAMIKGKEVYYDHCGSTKESYNDDKHIYLGEGAIHKINGVFQGTGPCEYTHFFIKK